MEVLLLGPTYHLPSSRSEREVVISFSSELGKGQGNEVMLENGVLDVIPEKSYSCTVVNIVARQTEITHELIHW